jgi:hypothetical protein
VIPLLDKECESGAMVHDKRTKNEESAGVYSGPCISMDLQAFGAGAAYFRFTHGLQNYFHPFQTNIDLSGSPSYKRSECSHKFWIFFYKKNISCPPHI